MSESIPSVKMADGHSIPMLGYGLGTANYKSGEKVFRQDIVDHTVMAIKLGYYHLDGAENYANEAEMGAAIKAAGVPREKLFVTTKTSCLAGETIELALRRSLKELDLTYVDLYLIHSPHWAKTPEDFQKKWAEMEAMQAAGLARSIGVSNYLKEHLEAVLKTAKSPPVVNQIEYHPYLQHDEDYLDFHRKHNITVEAYSPLTAVTAAEAKGGPVEPVYEKLTKKYGVSATDIALRWCLDQGIVALTTSKNEGRLKGFLETLPTFKLTEEEIKEISVEGRKKHLRIWWRHKVAPDDRR